MRHDGKPLRVLYLAQQFAPEVGAGPARVGELASRWVETGAAVTVVTAMPNRPQGRIYPGYRGRLLMREEADGIEVRRSWVYASPKFGVARTIFNNVSFLLTGLLNGVLARKPDVLIASSPPFLVLLAGYLLRIWYRVPLVLELRDLWPDYMVEMGLLRSSIGRKLLFALERALLRRADHVVVVTDSFRDTVSAKGVPRDRITVIPNGVDSAAYYGSDEPWPIPELRSRPETPTIGYLGNFGESQRLIQILEAAKLLQQRGRTVRIVLCGGGTDANRVREGLREEGLTNVDIFDPIPKESTRAFYSRCDACLVPLAPLAVLQQTVPSKLFEIMACERPVIGVVGGEAREIVDRSGGGLVATPGAPSEIADAIERCLDQPAPERERMGRNGRAFVQRRYERTGLADRYATILNGLVSRGGTPSRPSRNMAGTQTESR